MQVMRWPAMYPNPWPQPAFLVRPFQLLCLGWQHQRQKWQWYSGGWQCVLRRDERCYCLSLVQPVHGCWNTEWTMNRGRIRQVAARTDDVAQYLGLFSLSDTSIQTTRRVSQRSWVSGSSLTNQKGSGAFYAFTQHRLRWWPVPHWWKWKKPMYQPVKH